jgi:hypothetical protein
MRILVIVLLLFNTYLSAETIILKSGKALEGQILGQSSDTIVYQPKVGKKQSLPKLVIFRILYKSTEEEKKKVIYQALNHTKAQLNRQKTKDEKELEAYNLEEEARIKELEKSLEELRVERILKEEEELPALKARVLNLETRLSEVELFLNLNTDWKSKYLSHRSKWSVIWRSALIPGWGHNYIEENFLSYFYMSSFVLSSMVYAGANSNLQTVTNSHHTKMRDIFIIRPSIIQFLLTESNSINMGNQESTQALISSYTDLQKINDWTKSQTNLTEAQNNLSSAKKIMIGVYLLQLIHASISGYLWENTQIVPSKSEWSIQASPETNLLNPEKIGLSFFWEYRFKIQGL